MPQPDMAPSPFFSDHPPDCVYFSVALTLYRICVLVNMNRPRYHIGVLGTRCPLISLSIELLRLRFALLLGFFYGLVFDGLASNLLYVD